MIGAKPDLGGNLTAMAQCVSCNGASQSLPPQAFNNYGLDYPAFAVPRSVCHWTPGGDPAGDSCGCQDNSCPTGGGSDVQPRLGGGLPMLASKGL